jgi:putative aminopeptidase FrvX
VTISSATMPRLPDVDVALRTIEHIASAPTAPYHEHRVMRAIGAELDALGIPVEQDAYGQIHARVRSGAAARPLALLAHTDHPGFDVISASGREGRARILGGFHARLFSREVPVLICDDGASEPFAAMLDDFQPAIDVANNSLGHCRIRARRALAVGQWASLDLPAFEARGDELHLRAADDLALCAVAVLVLAALRDDPRPHDVRAVFTRGEETGLYGARLVAEDGLLPRESVVVSLEASRALPNVRPAAGPVVRPGDLYNTFSNDGERFLRVGRERLSEAGIPTQRALLTGGTCESSAFVRMGWTTTAIALPNVNYHNQTDEHDRFVPEIVRLSDLRGAVALLVEAATAAGADEDESWWPDVRTVPAEMRERLRRRS